MSKAILIPLARPIGVLSIFLGVHLVAPTPSARAQCSVGTTVGACPGDLGFEGCCSSSSVVTWCEGASLCEIDCSFNQGGSCCSPSLTTPGCCDSAITECVCTIDPFCCDADPFLPGGSWDEICVEYANTSCGGCTGSCSGPATSCGWRDTDGYYDCMQSPTADPSGAFPRQCGGGCVADCAGRSCGSDGCGGTCGSCGPNATCTAAGQCQATCSPQCSGRVCGSDGCGGLCGSCGPNTTCNAAGQCQASCAPACNGRQCGSDGCGGVCGSCAPGASCNASGLCVGECVPQCGSRECGEDGCGGSCGACDIGESCSNGSCKPAGCVSDCAGKDCGSDGCGGSCGECDDGQICDDDGSCADACSCEGKQCGDDGCGRVCGYCGPGTQCNVATFQCAPTAPQNDTSPTTPTSCPEGQIWDAYANACVVDTNPTRPVGNSKAGGDCAGGPAPLTGLALALAGLLTLRSARRGSRTRRAPTR